MDCSICRDLARAFEAGLSKYIEARSSASFQVCKSFAAKRNVDMERARYELEEHRLVCATDTRLFALLPEPGGTARLRRRAA